MRISSPKILIAQIFSLNLHRLRNANRHLSKAQFSLFDRTSPKDTCHKSREKHLKADKELYPVLNWLSNIIINDLNSVLDDSSYSALAQASMMAQPDGQCRQINNEEMSNDAFSLADILGEMNKVTRLYDDRNSTTSLRMLRDIFINPSSIAESESVDFTPRQKALIRCRVLNEIFYLVNNTSSEEHESMLEALDQGQGLSGTIKQSINTFQTRLNMFPVISGGIQSSLGLSSHSLKQELEHYCTTSSNSPIEFDIVSFFVRALIGRIYIPNVSSQNLHVPGVCREYYDLPLADKIVYQYMTICFARFVALDVHSGGFDNAISLSKTSHSSNPVQQHQVAESVAPPTTNAGYQTPLSGTSTPGRQLPSTPGYVQQNRSLGPKTVSFSPQKPNVCIIPPSLPSKRIDFGEFTSTRSMKRPKHHHEINGGAEFVEPRPLPSSRNPVAPYDQAATLQTLTAPLGEAGVGMSAFQVASPSSAFKKTPSPHHTNHVYQQSNTTQAQLEDNEVASINQDHGQQLPPPQNHQVEHEAQRKPRPLPSSRNPVASYDQAATLQTPTAPLGETGVGMSAFQVASNKSPSSAFKKTPSPHHANHVYQQSNTTQAQLEDNEVASINQDHGQQLPPPQNHRSPAFSLTSPAYSLTPPMPSPGFYEWLGLTSFE